MLSGILAASRPLSWVNTAVPFALTYLLAQGEVTVELVVGFIFFLVPYNIAMYGINDVFDYESDIVNPRKGGVEGAVLPKTMHRPLLVASAVTVIPFALYLFAVGTWASGATLALALFAVVAYSAPPLRFKEVPVLDSATSSAHFTLPAVVGALIGGGSIGGNLGVALVAFFLWGMASHALGAVQDVQSDRAGGIFYLAAAVLCFVLPSPGWAVGLLGVGYVANTLRFWNVTDETSAAVNRAWKVFLWLNYLTGAVVTIAVLASVVL